MEKDVTSDPVGIDLLGPQAVMTQAYLCAHLIE
jgi:hypothetical protein